MKIIIIALLASLSLGCQDNAKVERLEQRIANLETQIEALEAMEVHRSVVDSQIEGIYGRLDRIGVK
jgi:outer membrane murein-binding lipoprotein Lpp